MAEKSLAKQVEELQESYDRLFCLANSILSTLEVNHLRDIIVVVDNCNRPSETGKKDLEKLINDWKLFLDVYRNLVTPEVPEEDRLICSRAIYVATVR